MWTGKSFFLRKSIIFQFLISYICVLLIPIIICGTMYLKSLSTIQNEINRANAAVLKQIQQSLDSRINDVVKICNTIGFDQNIQTIMFSNEITGSQRLLMSKIIKNSFSNIIATNQFIKSFYVYFRNSGTILTPDCTYSSEEFFSGYNDPIITDPTWCGHTIKLSEEKPKPFLDGEKEPFIAYFRSLPITDMKGLMAVIAVYLDNKEISSVLNNNEWLDNRTFFILDENNRVLYSSDNTQTLYSIKYDELSNNSIENSYFNDQRVVISHIDSKIEGLKYISIIPFSTFDEKASFIRKLYILSLVLCFAIGGIIVFYFTKRNYNPLKELIQVIGKNAGLKGRGKHDEYYFIRETVLNAIQEKEEVQKKMEKQKNALKNNFMAGIVTGRTIDPTYVSEGLEYFNIHFESDSFAVMVFYIEDYSSISFEKDSGNYENSFKLAAFIIRNVAEELINRQNRGYMLEIEDMTACLINVGDGNESADEELKNVAVTAREFIEQNFGVRFSVAVSNVHDSLLQINEAYKEAMQAMEYRILAGSSKVIRYSDIKTEDKNRGSARYSFSDSQQLTNCFKSGDLKAAREVLDKIFGDNFYNKSLPIPIVKCKMFGLINNMISAMEEIDRDGRFIEKLNLVDCMLKCETIMDLQNEMKKILDQIEYYMETAQKAGDEQLNSDIIKYVDSFYSNQNMSVSMIADYFGMSIDTISRFFKKHMNVGLLYYINEYRIKKAKELLKQNELPIKTIAEMVGYGNSDAFIRVFKKTEGITPGRFREIL